MRRLDSKYFKYYLFAGPEVEASEGSSGTEAREVHILTTWGNFTQIRESPASQPQSSLSC